MFLQNRFVQSSKDLVRSQGFFSSSTRVQHSSSEEGSEGVESRHISAVSKASLWTRIQAQLTRAKKKVLRAKQAHGLRFYHPVTFQKAWAPRPHHVSFSGTMWIDLTMVGVLYRIDEFFLLNSNESFEGFWIPYVLFLAVFDAWEVGPLLQAEFRNYGISVVHSFMYLLSWLFLAMMGATIPYNNEKDLSGTSLNFTIASSDWTSDDQAAFSYVKLCHAALRVIMYLDVVVMSKSKRAQSAAVPRLITYACGLVPLVIAPILATNRVDKIIVASCFVASFLVQKAVWNAIMFLDIGELKTRAKSVRTNMPFIITRFRDWTQLQLGACVLGLITDFLQRPVFTEDRLSMYVVLVSSFFFLALLDLLSYSSDPRVFHDHALILGNIHAVLWFELFTLLGLSLFGVAVGLRYVFQHPPNAGNEQPSMVWLLVVSSILATLSILLQEANHHTPKKSTKGRKRLITAKMLAAGTCIVAPALTLSDNSYLVPNYWTTVNLALSTLLVVIIHAASGGLRKEVAQKTNIRLNGRILAALIARAWLHKARRAIAARKLQMDLAAAASGHSEGDRDQNHVNVNIINEESVISAEANQQPLASSTASLKNTASEASLGRKESVKMTPTKSSVLIAESHMSPMEALAASFSTSRASNVFGYNSDHGIEDDDNDSAVIENTEILRAIASFRKRSTMISDALSQKLLFDNEDEEDEDEDHEHVSVIDQEKDIFEDDFAAEKDDALDDEDPSEVILNRESGGAQSSHTPTIKEEEPSDIETDENLDRSLSKEEPLSTGLSDEVSVVILPEMSPISPLSPPPEDSFVDSINPSFANQASSSTESNLMAITTFIQPEPLIAVSNEAGTSATDVVAPTEPPQGSSRRVKFADEPPASPQRNLYKYVKDSVQQTSRTLKPAKRVVVNNKTTKQQQPVTSRVLRKVLNEKFYERPHLLAAQDVFAEYTVSWSDLFLDIIYVGVIFRLGDYLAQGLAIRQLNASEREPLSKTIFLFASLFYAIFSLWWIKLGFSSKCGVTDVFHKALDILQGLIVLIAAVNVTSPFELAQKDAYFAYVITGCLLIFHLSMMFLWYEVSVGKATTTREFACARRNIRRAVLSTVALLCALLATGLDAPLEILSLFWALSWFAPILERLATINSVTAEQKAPFLLRYVLHRQGDGALILLGEGVFQIIRAVGQFGVVPFLVFSLSFVNMAMARIALFQMDCFDEHAKKHAVFNSRLAHVGIGFIRSLASPAIVGVGVALKLIVEASTNHSTTLECLETANYELLCVCSFFSLGSFYSIYHIHRTFYFRSLRWRHLIVGWLLSGGFLIFPWIPCIHPLVITGGCSVVWAVAIIFHATTDDLFSTKDDQGVTAMPKSDNDQDVARRATRVARKSLYKMADA